MPSPMEEEEVEEEESVSVPPHAEVFDLSEDVSSEGGITPDMDSHVLFIKLKEVVRSCGFFSSI